MVLCTTVTLVLTILAFGSVAGWASVPAADFPIGIYSVPEGELAEVAEAGFNCTANYSTDSAASRAYIEAAAKAGLQVVAYAIYPQKQIEEPSGEAKLAEAIRLRKDMPNLLSWYLTDEPELNKQSPELITRLHDTVKRLDPKHPTCLVIALPQHYAPYAQIADVFMVDPYPMPSEPISTVFKRVAKGIADAGGRPVWCIPQSFSWAVWHGKHKPGDVHRPTPDEVRNMTYQALVAGAKGIIYWVYKGSKYYVRDFPEQWEADKRMAKELNHLAPVIAYGTADPTVAMTAGAGTRAMFRSYNGRRYAIVVNLGRTKRSVELTSKDAAKITDIFGAGDVTASDGRFRFDLEPIGVRVFEVR